MIPYFVKKVNLIFGLSLMHCGVLQGCTFTLIPNSMGSYHGQILIETEKDSWIGGQFRSELSVV